MTKIACAVVSDRGDLYLPGCLQSLLDNIGSQCSISHVVDDRDHHLGMAGAVRAAWAWALQTDCDYLFHVEEDFRFNGWVDLAEMVDVLERAPELSQLVLKRQPWSPEEKAAGGIVEAAPYEYHEFHSPYSRTVWTLHYRIFSLNPCLIPRRVLELGWPDGNEAEFTQTCLNRGSAFAFLGGKFDPPRVTHVGAQRGAGWRL